LQERSDKHPLSGPSYKRHCGLDPQSGPHSGKTLNHPVRTGLPLKGRNAGQIT